MHMVALAVGTKSRGCPMMDSAYPKHIKQKVSSWRITPTGLVSASLQNTGKLNHYRIIIKYMMGNMVTMCNQQSESTRHTISLQLTPKNKTGCASHTFFAAPGLASVISSQSREAVHQTICVWILPLFIRSKSPLALFVVPPDTSTYTVHFCGEAARPVIHQRKKKTNPTPAATWHEGSSLPSRRGERGRGHHGFPLLPWFGPWYRGTRGCRADVRGVCDVIVLHG